MQDQNPSLLTYTHLNIVGIWNVIFLFYYVRHWLSLLLFFCYFICDIIDISFTIFCCIFVEISISHVPELATLDSDLKHVLRALNTQPYMDNTHFKF